MASKVDIVIHGGGMVGLVMAAYLAELKLRVLVLEKSADQALLQADFLKPRAIDAAAYDRRVSAINPGNQRLLTSLAIWSAVPDCRRADYEWMRVWDGDGSGAINFDAAEVAQPCLGSIVENSVLRAAAWQRLLHFDNVEVRTGVSVEAIHPSDQHVDLTLDNGQLVRGSLLIGADGALSHVRRLLAIPAHQTAYNQTAFVATVETEKPHANTAWQRFTRHGPVAFLPLPQSHLCSIVWSLDDQKAHSVGQLNREEFAHQLGYAFEHCLGEVKLRSDFASFPLIKRHSETYLAPRCALIGDAAHTIHPLAGQGVNLGFQDAACLGQLIGELHARGRDFGLAANLRPFERERKTANYIMQQAMSGFKWLFGETRMLPTLLRNPMLTAADHSGPLKQLIVRQALGI